MSEKFKKAYSDITERLCQMTKEERLEWFANDPSLNIRFMKKIDGTTYIARCHFDRKTDESIIDKTQRIILKMNDASEI